jgi:hypothetical protein
MDCTIRWPQFFHAPTALKILRVVATHGPKFELLYSIENFKTHGWKFQRMGENFEAPVATHGYMLVHEKARSHGCQAARGCAWPPTAAADHGPPGSVSGRQWTLSREKTALGQSGISRSMAYLNLGRRRPRSTSLDHARLWHEGEEAWEKDAVKRAKEMTARGNSGYVLPGHAHFYAQVIMVCNCQKMRKGYEVLLEMSFSHFFSKKYRWERDMRNSWRCSEFDISLLSKVTCKIYLKFIG